MSHTAVNNAFSGRIYFKYHYRICFANMGWINNLINAIKNQKYLSLIWNCSSCEPGFFKDIRWMRRAYFVFGMLPIYQMKNGKVAFKYLSFHLLYSVCMYTFLTTLCIKLIVIERFKKLMSLLDDFDGFIFNLMFMSFVKTQFFYSIGGWLASKNIALYHNMWKDFEVLYKRKLGKPLRLENLETYSNRVVIICFTSSFCLIGGQLFTLPTYTFQECIAYIPSSMCTSIYIGITLINCTALRKAGRSLLEQLKSDLQRSPVTQDIIVLHKKLWMDLSNIAQQLGTSFFNYNFVVLLGTLIDLIMSGYGYLSILIMKGKTNTSFTIISKEELGLIVATICSVYVLIQICHCYYHVTDKLTTPFIDELCMATTCYHNPKVNKEIELFLLSIKNNPPVITLGGYVDIDRRLITKVISIITTYYVVLIQFKMSFNPSPPAPTI